MSVSLLTGRYQPLSTIRQALSCVAGFTSCYVLLASLGKQRFVKVALIMLIRIFRAEMGVPTTPPHDKSGPRTSVHALKSLARN
jgi:hypothetical protein